MNRPKLQLLPHLSEKTYAQSNNRVYVVDVPKNANKLTIKQAMLSQFEVKVTKINLTNIPGKSKRTISRNGRRIASGKDSNIRKAYVSLAEGNRLPFFDTIEEEEKKVEKVQDELAKKQEAEIKPKKRLGIRRNKSTGENK